MIATREHALQALQALTGTRNPSAGQVADLGPEVEQFVYDFVLPLAGTKDSPPTVDEMDYLEELLDEYIPPPHPDDQDWLTEEEIRRRVENVVASLGLDRHGLHEEPDEMAKFFGAHYIPGEVRIATRGYGAPFENGLTVVVTSWRDAGTITREYNRRYNPVYFKLWAPILDDIFATDTMVWSNFRVGIHSGKFVPESNAETYKTGQNNRTERRGYRVAELVALGDLCEWVFNDEHDICTRCEALIRTGADGHAWQPEFERTPDENIYCLDCVQSDASLQADYLDRRVNQNRLVNFDVVNPDDFGWTELEFDYEHGLHHGQNDDPDAIIKALGDTPCLFTGSVGQFDVNFRVWVKEEDVEAACEILDVADTKLPYDLVTEMKKALKGKPAEIMVRMAEFKDGEIVSSTTNNDEEADG